MTRRLTSPAAIVLALLLVVHTALCACRPAVATVDAPAPHCPSCVTDRNDTQTPASPDSPPHDCPHCHHTLTAERPASFDTLTALDLNNVFPPVLSATDALRVTAATATEAVDMTVTKPTNVVARLNCALTL